MKRQLKRLAKVAITGTMILSMSISAFATQSKEEVKQNIEALEKKQQELQGRLNGLKQNKSDVQSYVAQLDEELAVLGAEISTTQASLDTTQGNIDATQAQIEQTQKELEEAKAKEERQYTALKKRIKAMYEEGEPGYLEILFQAQDMESMLNADEYATKISDYDNNLLTSIKETKASIVNFEATLVTQKEELEVAKTELENTKKELEVRKASVDMIMAQKQEELSKIEISIENAASEYGDVEGEKKSNEEILAAINASEEKARKEAEARAKEQQANQNNNSTSTGTGSVSNGTPSSQGFLWPTPSVRSISSGFGPRRAPVAGASTYHRGVDVPAATGTSVVAAADGVVATSAYHNLRGYYVVINHGNGYSTLYQHLASSTVSVGQSVSRGQQVAISGSSGIGTGAHLHFELWSNGTPIDPMNYFNVNN